jgi:hypothetical protein
MKLHPEDPRLTAFLLGELPAEEAAAVERAIADDPALLEAMRGMESIKILLTETLDPGSIRLLPQQRETIRAAVREQEKILRPFPSASWKRWGIPLAAAATITLGIIIFFRNQKPQEPATAARTPAEPSATAASPKVRLMPAPGPVDRAKPVLATAKPSAPDHSGLPALRPRSYLAAADFPTMELPVLSGKSSLEWIRKSIIDKRELPSRNAVRLEEILNSFALRPAGVTVVARQANTQWHPDNRETGITTHAATIATETLACPWKPSASLVLVSIKGNPYSDSEIKAVFHAARENVSRYRLLGFSPVEGGDEAPLPTNLPAKTSTTLVIEVETANAATAIGSIEWSVNGRNAASVPLTRHGSAEPSDDARFAALVCTFALWLSQDDGGLIDTDLLAALTRESASDNLSGDRAQLLELIDRSLQL